MANSLGAAQRKRRRGAVVPVHCDGYFDHASRVQDPEPDV